MRLHLSLALILLPLLTTSEAAERLRVELNDGRVISGPVVARDGDSLSIEVVETTASGRTMTMVVKCPLAQIVRKEVLPDPEQEYARQSAAATTAATHVAVAIRCLDEWQRRDRALEHARKAIALDAGNTEAAALMTRLGWVLADGAWVEEATWLERQGKIRFEGSVITLAERDAILAQRGKAAEAEAVTRAAASRERDLESATKKLRDIDADLAEYDRTLAEIATQLTTLAGADERLAQAKAAADAARSALEVEQDEERERNRKSSGTTSGTSRALREAQEASTTADRTYNELRRANASVAREQQRLESQRASIEKKQASLREERATTEAKRAALSGSATPAAGTAETPAAPPQTEPAPLR